MRRRVRNRLYDTVFRFRPYYQSDTGGGVMVSASVFQNQVGAQESSKPAAGWVRQNPAPLLFYAHESCSYLLPDSSFAWFYA